MHILTTPTLNDEVLSDIIARDCVLWITFDKLDDASILDSCIALVDGPWRAIYVETTSNELATALEERSLQASSRDLSGAFLHLIASDPLLLVLQRRAKPVFFLNGRADRSEIEGTELSTRSAKRRRLNMTARLRDIEPRRVVVVGNNPILAIEDLVDLWDSEFRSLLTIVTDDQRVLNDATPLLEQSLNLNVVQWISQPVHNFATTITKRVVQFATKANLMVRVRLPGDKLLEVDLATAEMTEQPIADICEFITVNDLLPVSPDDLKEQEFQSFFTRNEVLWRPYAAGLYWSKNKSPERELLKQLYRQLTEPAENIQILSVVSEPGAGGTTQARAFSYAAARAGFPVLLTKQHSDVPTALELTSFLYRALGEISKKSSTEGHENTSEPVWLLVLDVQHISRGFEDLERLCVDIIRSGRKVAILAVVSSDSPMEPPESISHNELAYVSHNLEAQDVVDLGNHLNTFLRNFGKDKTPDEWKSFWLNHRPDIDTGIASFWIALEFWLTGFLTLGESIQSWVLKQFKALSGGIDVQLTIMEIAALSIERKATPERLLTPLKSPKFPWSYALEKARHEAPGLGIVNANSVPYGRIWAIAHDVLARYLLNGIWNDRPLCKQLAIQLYEDPIELRLAMIGQVSKRAVVGEPFARPFATSLAMTVLKLDEQNGNAEFFKYWRKVISILDTVPQTIHLSSRTFNHHVAISRRRITQDQLFQISDIEKKDLLTKAAQEVEFSLDQIDSSHDDESNLNLLNTLALIYQDLSELERGISGDPTELSRLLAKADEITSRALKENPNSPYVLETAAKNLLRQTISNREACEKVESAAKALSFIFQASRLDTAFARRMKLGQLAAQALRRLREEIAENAIEQLCAAGNSFGFIAKAWSSMPIDNEEEASLLLDSIDSPLAANAIKILNGAPTRDWLLVSLMYELAVIAEEKNFTFQLALLDELSSTRGYQLSLQQILERGVLLFFAGQHKLAANEFGWLRPKVKESQIIVFVPPRLRWLLTPDRSDRATCTAVVMDSAASARGMAKVRELGGIAAPFNPQEFGKARMAPHEQFKCQVTFSAMGPFLKPVDSPHK